MLTLLLSLLIFLIVLYVVWIVIQKLGLPEPVPLVIILLVLIAGIYYFVGRGGLIL